VDLYLHSPYVFMTCCLIKRGIFLNGVVTNLNCAGFVTFITAVRLHVEVFWAVTPCNVVAGYF
jgi:hypothetical protein